MKVFRTELYFAYPKTAACIVGAGVLMGWFLGILQCMAIAAGVCIVVLRYIFEASIRSKKIPRVAQEIIICYFIAIFAMFVVAYLRS